MRELSGGEVMLDDMRGDSVELVDTHRARFVNSTHKHYRKPDGGVGDNVFDDNNDVESEMHTIKKIKNEDEK